VSSYVNVLSASELTVDKFVMVGCVVKFLTKHKRHELLSQLKVLFTSSFDRQLRPSLPDMLVFDSLSSRLNLRWKTLCF